VNYRRHFRTRLIIYSAIIVTPLLAVLGYNAYTSFGQSEKAVLQSVENYSLYIAHDVEDLLLRSERTLKYLAVRPEILALDSKHCDPWLKEFIGFAPEYANLGVITAAGVPVCLAASTPGSAPRSFAEFPWFRHAMQVDGFASSAPFLGPITLKHVSVFSYPLRDHAGQRIGTLALPLELGSLDQLWRAISLPAGSAIAVFDSDGIFMARFPDAENWVGKSAREVLAAARRAAPGGVGVAAGIDGVERAFALKTIPKYGWQVVVGIRTADVFRSDRDARTRSLAVIGAVVLFVLFLVSILSRRLSFPLRDLSTTVRAVAEGDFSVRANETDSGEFHELAQQFNRMLRMREQAENELRAQTERLRIGQATAGMIVMEWDIANDELSWSDSPEWLRGPLPESGKYPFYVEQVHPEDRERFLAVRTEGIDTLRRRSQEYRIVRTDGETRWLRSQHVVFPGADGKAARMLVALLDITERKQAEEEIRRLNESLEQKVRERTRELERSNEELAAFSYSVAHDLRTPLRGINGFSAFLAGEYAGKLDATALGYLQRIQAAAIRMGEVMDDLLALAHAGRVELQRQEVDLSALAQAVAASFESAAPQRRAEFVIAAGITADADPGLMRIALDNLFSNAWKFSAKAEGARIEFGMITAEGKPAYFVRDNGAGFDSAFSGKLFEQFQRLHTDKEYEGAGVGLAIVARVIRRHGGRIWADGAVGQGAVFYFTLG